MPGPRDYSSGTRAALQAFSRGTCYFPRCREPIVKQVQGVEPIQYEKNYHIAHIHAAKGRGARYDSSMSDYERIAIENLVLLCPQHHIHVDIRHPKKYGPQTMLAWKADREAGVQDALAGLNGLTEGRLQEIITEAFAAKQDQIIETLARLEQNDAEAARVMQEILEELDRLRAGGPILDPDSVTMLHDASNSLRNLPDSAEVLWDAVQGLKSLPGHAEARSLAGQDLGNLQDHADAINAAADHLGRMVGRLENMEGGWN